MTSRGPSTCALELGALYSAYEDATFAGVGAGAARIAARINLVRAEFKAASNGASEALWGVYPGTGRWVDVDPLGTTAFERSVCNLVEWLNGAWWLREGEAQGLGRPRASIIDIAYFGVMMAKTGKSTRAISPKPLLSPATLSRRLTEPWTHEVLTALCIETSRVAGRDPWARWPPEVGVKPPWGKSSRGRRGAALCATVAMNVDEVLAASSSPVAVAPVTA